MFSGYGTANLQSSVMAMRRVTFPTDYYSSIYADSNNLDFLITFYQGSTVGYSTLINGYTIVGKKM